MMWILLTALIPILIYFYCIKYLYYWKNRNVQQDTILNVFVENFFMIFKRQSAANVAKQLQRAFPNEKCYGIMQFNTPVLVLKTPDIMKQFLIKDFDYFTDRRTMVPEDIDPLWGKNVFALKGHSWKNMRSSLSPSFTSSKIKWLFTLMKETTEKFVDYFKNQDEIVIKLEMKDVFMRFCNDVIANTIFGVEVDSLRDKDNTFFQMSKTAFDFKSFSKFVKLFGYMMSPTLYKILGMKVFDEDVNTFFRKVIDDSVKNREEKGIIRQDMIHILMEARKGIDSSEENNVIEATVDQTSGKLTKHFSNEDITAQALMFFFAGFETVSTLMSFMAYELAVNTEVQNLLREEIIETLTETGGKLTYDAIMKMKYMDMVVSEALRKWPPAIAVDRVSTNPYTIDPSSSNEKPIHLEKGTVVMIPILGIHHDPKLFPNPDRFDPERFNEENKRNIAPNSYMPFGLGPRGCMGTRYALLEIKVIFFYLLKEFEIVPVKETKIPIMLANSLFDISIEGGNWLGLKRLTS